MFFCTCIVCLTFVCRVYMMISWYETVIQYGPQCTYYFKSGCLRKRGFYFHKGFKRRNFANEFLHCQFLCIYRSWTRAKHAQSSQWVQLIFFHDTSNESVWNFSEAIFVLLTLFMQSLLTDVCCVRKQCTYTAPDLAKMGAGQLKNPLRVLPRTCSLRMLFIKPTPALPANKGAPFRKDWFPIFLWTNFCSANMFLKNNNIYLFF